MRILIIDNYDSFTYNLFQVVGAIIKAEPIVVRNDAIDLKGIVDLDPGAIILSPGPGHPAVPRDFGVCADVIRELGGKKPVLGVCLGHQGMIHYLGGSVIRAPRIVHGKTSRIKHDGKYLFAGLPENLEVMRYHSLVGDRTKIPSVLEITAETEDGLVMGIRHKTWPMFGVQFHPESVGTPLGTRMLENFLGS
jgi:anthranilate synthase component II